MAALHSPSPVPCSSYTLLMSTSIHSLIGDSTFNDMVTSEYLCLDMCVYTHVYQY